MAPLTIAFVGGAGTGKTFRLVQGVRQFVAKRGLAPEQQVLGLTFMHGSRRRMVERLAPLRDEAIRCRVETLDSFSLRLVRRFRRWCGLGAREISVRFDSSAPHEWQVERDTWRGSSNLVRYEAARLLASPEVAATLRASYPLVLVDEAQDCDAHLLNLIQALASATQVVIAADPFQDLNRSDESSPLIEWLNSAASGNPQRAHIVLLSEPQRTTEDVLLETARALRTCTACCGGVEVLGVDGSGLAAYEIQKRIVWEGWRGSLALITPTGPDSSRIVSGVLKSLHGTKCNGKLIGTPFGWGNSERDMQEKVTGEIRQRFPSAQPISIDELRAEASQQAGGGPVAQALRSVIRRARLMGLSAATVEDLLEAAERVAHARRTQRSPDSGSAQTAMTVHGAKNREFDYVFVLWPREVRGGDVSQRKLLYNAVTRARKNAVILVQGGPARLEGEMILRMLVPAPTLTPVELAPEI